MTKSQPGVTTCQWATPTLSLPYPLWLTAEESPWSCTRTADARPLELTDACATCPKWAAAPTAPRAGARPSCAAES
jgi:hypothetical protein